MTTTDHIARVKKLAASAMAWEDQDQAHVCRCPTCGVAEKLLRSKLRREDADRITLRASMCGDGSYPYLASVRVDGQEVYRIMAKPDEVFAEDVMADIKAALRRHP